MPPDLQRIRLADGAQLTYVIRGEGPPLLLHRPLGGHLGLWGEFADVLARHFRVIAFDPRGVGRSSPLPRGHGTRAMAGDALALLDALRVDRAHLFGLSLGGMVASWQAIDAPGRTGGLVLASTLPEASAASLTALTRLGGLARCYLRPGVEAEVCLVKRILSPAFRLAHPRRLAAIERAVREVPTSRTSLRRLIFAAARHHAGPMLRRVEAPPLLLFGGLDPFVSRRTREDLACDFSGATVEILEGVGHDLTLEAPVTTAERVIAFLAAPGQSVGPSGH
jgi:3-oxoadipate enol-lactonase